MLYATYDLTTIESEIRTHYGLLQQHRKHRNRLEKLGYRLSFGAAYERQCIVEATETLHRLFAVRKVRKLGG